jgi:uncharacterized protein (DUF362 family)
LASKVAIIEFDKDKEKEAITRALMLLGIRRDLTASERPVVVKVGVFSHKVGNHTSVRVVDAIASIFEKAPNIMLTEADNYQGTGTERLQLWKELFTDRVVPINLSDDPEPVKMTLAGQEINMPRLLLEPNVLVNTHILRSFDKGSILKNLFGCILDSKRVKYHKVLPALLADIYEAIGGVDLAVLDGTQFWHGAGDNPVQMNTLIVGKDAVAVETVGAVLAGLDPEKMPVIQEFVKRNLGEGTLENIEVVGASFESVKNKFMSVVRAQKKQKRSGPQTWGGKANKVYKELIREGYFKQPQKRTMEDVLKTLETRDITTKEREKNVADALARMVKSGILKKNKTSDGKAYWTD